MRVDILTTCLATSLALLLAAPSLAGAAGPSEEVSYIITADDYPVVIAGYRSVLRKDGSSKAVSEKAAVEAATPAFSQPSRSSWYTRRLDRIVPSDGADVEAATTSAGARAGVRSDGGCAALRAALDRPWC